VSRGALEMSMYFSHLAISPKADLFVDIMNWIELQGAVNVRKEQVNESNLSFLGGSWSGIVFFIDS